jgi:hypothetical protein
LIAKFLARLIRMIGDVSMLLALGVIVSECDKDVSTSKGVEFVIAPSLNMREVPYLVILPHFNKLSNILIERILIIQRSPQRLTVLRVISTLETLFRTVVNNRDTLREDGKC